MAAKDKPLIAVDFDGVLHSYTSGWQGARTIADPPVPGAIYFVLRLITCPHVAVAIFSCRSRHWGGERAMRSWLWGHLERAAEELGLHPNLLETRFLEIRWPVLKPPAHVFLDDRAIQFTGTFPSISELIEFKPWNKKESQ